MRRGTVVILRVPLRTHPLVACFCDCQLYHEDEGDDDDDDDNDDDQI